MAELKAHVDMLRRAVVAFFEDTLPNSPNIRMLLYWVKLCDRTQDIIEQHKAEITEVPPYQTVLAAFKEGIAQWGQMQENLQQARDQFDTWVPRLTKIEMNMYVELTVLLEALDQSDLYLGLRPRDGRIHDSDTFKWDHPSMVESRLFWLRCFGLSSESRTKKEFCQVLTLYLRLEYPKALFHDPLFEDALSEAIDPWKMNELGYVGQRLATVSPTTWRLFSWRLGPLPDMYDKVTAVTEIVDEKKQTIKCAKWFTDNSKLSMQIDLAKKERRQPGGHHFMIRPGYEDSAHAYTFTYSRNKTQKSTRIQYQPSTSNPTGRQYTIPTVANKPPAKFHTLSELTRTVLKAITWTADSAAIKAAQDAWEAHSISVADVEDYEDQLLKWVMQLREQLGVDAKHVPAPPTQSRSEARKAIADALATPESFEEYLHTVGLLDESKDQEVMQRSRDSQLIKQTVINYKQKIPNDSSKKQEPLVHILVRKAGHSTKWLGILHKLMDAGVLSWKTLAASHPACGTPAEWLIKRAGLAIGGCNYLKETLEWVLKDQAHQAPYDVDELFDVYIELARLFAASVPAQLTKSDRKSQSKDSIASPDEKSSVAVAGPNDVHTLTGKAFEWFLLEICMQSAWEKRSPFQTRFYDDAVDVLAQMVVDEELVDDTGAAPALVSDHFNPQNYILDYKEPEEFEEIPGIIRAVEKTLSFLMHKMFPKLDELSQMQALWRQPSDYGRQHAAHTEPSAVELPLLGIDVDADRPPLPPLDDEKKLPQSSSDVELVSVNRPRANTAAKRERDKNLIEQHAKAQQDLMRRRQAFLAGGVGDDARDCPVLVITKRCRTRNPSELLKSFLNWGAQFDKLDSDLRTPLHYMAEYCSNYTVQDWSDLLAEDRPSLRSVVNHRDKNNLTPLGILYNKDGNTSLEQHMMFLLIVHGATIQGLGETEDESAPKTASSHEQPPFGSIVSTYLQNNEWARWYVLKAAIDNEDLQLANVILKPDSLMGLPYMLKPKYLFDLPLWLWNTERRRKRRDRQNSSFGRRTRTELYTARTTAHEREDDERAAKFQALYSMKKRKFESRKSEFVEASMLHLAVQSRRRNPKIVEMILEYDAPSGKRIARGNFFSSQRLEKARSDRRTRDLQEMVRKYCSAPNVDYVDSYGRTVLHIACGQPPLKTNDAIADLLIGQVNIIQKDRAGFTALHYATYYGRLYVVDRLIQAHSTVSAISGVEDTHLDRDDEAQDIIGDGDDVTFYSRVGLAMDDESRDARVREFTALQRTALHVAALNGDWQICSSLISAQRDLVNSLDSQGWTPLALALYMKRKMEELVQGVRQPTEMRPTLIHSFLYKHVIAPHRKTAGKDGGRLSLTEMNATVQFIADVEDVVDEWESREQHCEALKQYGDMERRLQRLRQRGRTQSNINSRIGFGADNTNQFVDIEIAPDDREKQLEQGMEALKSNHRFLENRYAEYLSPARHELKEVNRETLQQKWVNDYTATIDILLKGGADIKRSTDACRKKIGHLIDIESSFEQLHNQVQNLEAAQKNSSNSAKLELYRHQQQEVFADKSNQIVIEQYFNTYISPIQRRKLYRYAIILLVLTLLGIYETTRDSQAGFFLHRVMKETLIEDEFDFPVSPLKRTFKDIDAKDEFWLWTRGPFLDVFYPSTPPRYWDGNVQVPRAASGFTNGGFIQEQNRVVGVPRIRQVRSRSTECSGLPSDFKDWAVTCFETVGRNAETAAFGPNLEYSYSSGDKIEGIMTFGRAGIYEPGGYVLDFPKLTDANARNTTRTILLELEDNNWIDSKTRAVFVEFTVFNPNHDFFVHGAIMVEFPRSGGTVPSWEFTVGQFKRYLTPIDDFALFLEICVLVYFLVDLAYTLQVTRYDSKVLTGFYFVLYVFMNLFLLCAIILHIIGFVWGVEADWLEDGYVPATRIARIIDLEVAFISLVVFCGWIRLLDYLSVWRTFARLLVMITMMIKKLADFLILFAIVISCFASAEYIAYGYAQEQSYIWFFGLLTRISWTFAGRDINSFVGEHRILGTLYALLFVVTINLLLLNLVIAMMNSAYEAAKTQSGDAYWARKQYDVTVQYSWDHAMIGGKCAVPLHGCWMCLGRVYSNVMEPVVDFLRACWKRMKQFGWLLLQGVGVVLTIATCGCCCRKERPDQVELLHETEMFNE